MTIRERSWEAKLPELCDNSCIFGHVLHDAQVIMAAQQTAVCNAAIQSEHVVTLLAAPAGRRCQLEEAEVVGAPCGAWYVQEEDVLCRFCMRTKLLTREEMGQGVSIEFRAPDSASNEWRSRTAGLESMPALGKLRISACAAEKFSKVSEQLVAELPSFPLVRQRVGQILQIKMVRTTEVQIAPCILIDLVPLKKVNVNV